MLAISIHALVASVIALFPAPTPASDEIAKANAFFDRFVVLEQSFDPAISELYDDAARITNTYRDPDGYVRRLNVTVPRYRARIRTIFPFAKQLGDVREYSNVSFERQEGYVRIKANRRSALRPRGEFVSLLVGAGLDGEWRIIEEVSDVHPYSQLADAGDHWASVSMDIYGNGDQTSVGGLGMSLK